MNGIEMVKTKQKTKEERVQFVPYKFKMNNNSITNSCLKKTVCLKENVSVES